MPRLKLTETTATRWGRCERARDGTLCRRQLVGSGTSSPLLTKLPRRGSAAASWRRTDGDADVASRLWRVETRKGLRCGMTPAGEWMGRQRRLRGAERLVSLGKTTAFGDENMGGKKKKWLASRLGVRAPGANFAHNDARIGRADKLGTRLALCWS